MKPVEMDTSTSNNVNGEETKADSQAAHLRLLAEVASKSHLVLSSVIHTPIIEATPQAVQFGPIIHGTSRRQKAYHLPDISREQQAAVSQAKKYAKEQSIKSVLMKQTIAHQQQQMLHFQTTVQRQQALALMCRSVALMCRVYVGSLNVDVDEQMLRTGFAPFGAIKTINLSWDPITNKHKGFAFIEFELPEAAQIALETMNGSMLGGRNIKVVRPHCSPQAGKEMNPALNRNGANVMPQAQPIIDRLADEAKSFNRVYVSSIHHDLSENDIQSVFEAFGKIRKCELAPDPLKIGKHRGYGFIEYEKMQGAEDSVTSMNRFDLGGQLLRVGMAITPPQATITPTPITAITAIPTAAAVAMAAVTAKITAMEVASVASKVGSGVKTAPTDEAGDAGTSVIATPASTASPTPAPASTPATTASTLQGIPPLIPPTPAVVALAPTATTTPLPLLAANPASPAAATSPPAPSVVHAPPPPLIPLATPAAPVAQVSSPFSSSPATSTPPPGLVTPTALCSSSSLPASPLPIGEEQQITMDLTESQKKLVAEAAPVQSIAAQENINISGSSQRNILMQKLMQRNTNELRIVVLRNMVTADDVDDDLQSEVESECAKFGHVIKVVIYQERQSEDEDAEIIVKIFVEFSMSSEAASAVKALDARYFGGNRVSAQLYDPVLYKTNDFSS